MLKYKSVIIHLVLLNFINNIIEIKSYTMLPQYTVEKMHSDPNYIRVMTVIKRTRTKIPPDQLRTISTVGLLNGAIETEKNLQKYLTDKVTDLVLNVNMDSDEKKQRIGELEKIIERDRNAVKILGAVLDYASQTINSTQYKNQMKKIMREHAKGQKQIKKNQLKNENMDERMTDLKSNILKHVQVMKNTIGEKSNKTMLYLETLSQLKDFKIRRTQIVRNQTEFEPDNILHSVIKDNVDDNLIDPMKLSEASEFSFKEFENEFTNNRLKRKQIPGKSKKTQSVQNSGTHNNPLAENISVNEQGNVKLAKQEEENTDEKENDENDFGEEPSGGGGGGLPGGLPGLIASLSGGEEGSDIGALLGAITGIVTQLFGPGGLDIPSLINTGTSLIAGLLGGGRNFGTVLGEYVGLAFDGLSGGGGADLNGKFLGNLIGTTLAELSADPDNEEGPPKPGLFVQKFLTNFIKAKNRMAGDSDEEVESGENESGNGNTNGKGSNSFSFIKHIARAIAGGVTSFILNASLGSSSGSSKGSASLFSSSSDGSGQHHRSFIKH